MRSIHSLLSRWLPLLAVLFLSGCAHSPGFYTGDSLKADAKNPDAVPPGALHSITPELLSQQRASRKDDIPAQVKQLFGTAQPYTIGSGDILNIVVWDHPQLSNPGAGAGASGRRVHPVLLLRDPHHAEARPPVLGCGVGVGNCGQSCGGH